MKFRLLIRLALGKSPGELSDILAPEINRHAQQAKSASQSTEGTKGTIVAIAFHKSSSAIARSERDKSSERTNNDEQRASTCWITVQQVCDRNNVGTHEAEIVGCHCPRIYKPVVLLRMSGSLAVQDGGEHSNDYRDDKRYNSGFWLVHASVAPRKPLDDCIGAGSE